MKASRQVMSAHAGPTTTNLEGGVVMATANSSHAGRHLRSKHQGLIAYFAPFSLLVLQI